MLRIDPRSALPHKIETDRLVLRAPIRGDVPQLIKLADNRNVADWLRRLPHPYTRADAVAFIEIIAQRAENKPYAITLEGVGLIGVVGFHFWTDAPPELGYWLGEPYWGKGYTTEAARALIETAQATGQYPQIGAWALKDNERSINVLTKLRFKKLRESKSEDVKDKGRKLVHFIREQGR
jgi:RimJ/RimL family protein N-acetyltransferase